MKYGLQITLFYTMFVLQLVIAPFLIPLIMLMYYYEDLKNLKNLKNHKK
jgi:hypothetical protein